MKAKVAFAGIAVICVVCGASFAVILRGKQLPRMKLSDGSEFRVVQICYGTEPEDHHLGRGAKQLFWVWNHLPHRLRIVLPYPDYGESGESPSTPHTAVSIWCAWFKPGVSRQPILGPSGDVIMTLDSGEEKNLGWPNPIDDYRQIFIIDPPTNSKRLRFAVPVNWLEKPAAFEIENPAYGKSR